jgi:hypothetical protein
MAGYSGTPLAKKLGIRPGAALHLVNAPPDAESWLAPLPEGVTRPKPGTQNLDVVVCFTTQAADLTRRFAALKRALKPAGGLWVSWPKKSSKVPTDLDENIIRAIGLKLGLVDNKVCAVSEVWSGLRFVWRVKDR